MHFFVTGHTGFKGSWLILLLRSLGHKVSGYALETPGGLFELGSLESELSENFIADIRDLNTLEKALKTSNPDFVIHLAAQPLVIQSYANPIETYEVNVDGTRNILNITGRLPSLPPVLVITTDKVYKDNGVGGYRETDSLGGADPYSASKAMADIMSSSFSFSYPERQIHIARAGNVIGAFDANAGRLIPDIVRARRKGETLYLRGPQSIRPWQHVLDCLGGYLLFANAMTSSRKPPKALNFGPQMSDYRTVMQVVRTAEAIGGRLKIEFEESGFKETEKLTLDTSLARATLGWRDVIGFEESIEWSLVGNSSGEARQLALGQIESFLLRSQLQSQLSRGRLGEMSQGY